MSSPDITAYDDRVAHPSAGSSDALLLIVATLIGTTLALDRFVPFQIAGLTPTFILGLAFGTLGYWVGVTEPILRSFLRWIVPFSVWAVVSVLAASRFSSLGSSAGILIWILLMPGIATMLLDRRRFRALLIGLVIGAGFLLSVVVWRFARGVRILDAGYLQLLGLNRNTVDVSIVWLIAPVLWSKTLGLPRIARFLFLATSVLWLVSSEGRTGLIALLMTPLVFSLLKPSSAFSRAARLGMALALVGLLYVALTSVSIPGLPGAQRIAQYQTAERTESDEIRLLLNEKSIALGLKHPVTGVGWGLYRNQYDPVIEKGRTAHIREVTARAPAHNTYYEVLATTGFPGVILYVGAFLVPLIGGIRNSHDRDVRALTTGYVIALFSITFHSSFGSMPALCAGVLLAAIARAGPRSATAAA